MKNEYNHIDRRSLLYLILEEMVFLKETKKVTDYVSKLLKSVRTKVKSIYSKFMNNEWNRGLLLLSGYMTFSSILLLVAYKLVMIS